MPTEDCLSDQINDAVIAAWKPAPLVPHSVLHGILLCASPAVKWRQRGVVVSTALLWGICALTAFVSVYAEQPYKCHGPPSTWQPPERGTVAYGFHLCGEEGHWKLELLGSLFFVGGGIGVLIGGRLADVIGRYNATMLMLSFQVLGLVGCATAPTYSMYVACRVLTGFGSLGYCPASFAAAYEWIVPGWRMAVGIGLFNIAYAFGEFGAVALALLVNGWREFTLAIAIVAFIGSLLVAALMRESPSWLYSQPGREREALELLGQASGVVHIHEDGKECATEVATQDAQSLSQGLRASGDSSVACISQVKDADWVYNRFATWAMTFLFFTCATSFYGISLEVAGLGNDIYESAAYSAAIEPPACVLAVLLIGRPSLGRRMTNIILFAGGGIACLLMVVIANGYSARIACMMCGKFFLSAAFSNIYFWASELYVPACRGQGLALCSFAAKIGSILAPINAGMLGTIGTYGAFGTLGVCASLVCWAFLPETAIQTSAKDEADKA